MTRKPTVIRSQLSPGDLLDVLRHEGQLRHAADLPADLRSTGVHAATFKMGKDGSFRVDLEGVRANGVTGASIVGRGRIAAAPDGGSEIALTVGGSVMTRLKPVFALAFCVYVGVKLWREDPGPGAIVPPAFALPMLLLILWVEVMRLVNGVRPGLVQLVERLATGSLRVPSPTHDAPAG